jgi:long-chain fatty acid transport protein
MNITRNRSVLALSVAFALAAGSASATNGYYTHGTGTKSKAQAGAGSANPEEILVLATNPAGIAFVPESIDAGVGFFSPMREYSTSPSQAPGACFAPGQCLLTIGPNELYSENEFFPIPFVAMNWALSDADFLAAAFYGRGGMNTRWVGGTVTYDPFFGGPGSTGAVTLPGTYGDGTAGVDLMQAFLNLTYARKLGDEFSLGLSGIVAIQRFEARGLDNFAPFTETFVRGLTPTGPTAFPNKLSDNGHDMSYGYGGSVGFQWNPTEMFGFAAAYTTKMSMTELGDYEDLFAQNGGFDMPSTWTVGIAVKPNDQVALMFDVQEIKYTDVDSVANGIENLFSCPILNPASTNPEFCLGGNKGAGFGWEDMTVYKFGASWKYSDTWTWRAGYSFTDQPIPKDQMTFNILAPGVMEEHITLGFTQTMPSGNEVNLSFMFAPENTVRGPQNFDPTQNVRLSMKQIELEISYSWKR